MRRGLTLRMHTFPLRRNSLVVFLLLARAVAVSTEQWTGNSEQCLSEQGPAEATCCGGCFQEVYIFYRHFYPHALPPATLRVGTFRWHTWDSGGGPIRQLANWICIFNLLLISPFSFVTYFLIYIIKKIFKTNLKLFFTNQQHLTLKYYCFFISSELNALFVLHCHSHLKT